MRGIVAFEITVETADYDLHSSLASYAESALWRLVQGLANLRDTKGNILVTDFYEDADQLTDTEKKLSAINEFDEVEIQQIMGLRRPLLTTNPKSALVNGATLTINGITTGYQEEGVKTVLPRFASAKLDCRLAPDQDPKRILQVIQNHLERNDFGDGLNLPVLGVGVGYANSNDHGTDENIRLTDFLQATKYLNELLHEFGS